MDPLFCSILGKLENQKRRASYEARRGQVI
jgi:hypothetical protein